LFYHYLFYCLYDVITFILCTVYINGTVDPPYTQTPFVRFVVYLLYNLLCVQWSLSRYFGHVQML